MSRAEWLKQYRAFRTAATFWDRFPQLDKLPDIPSPAAAAPFDGQCLSHTRLHGDHLARSTGHQGQVTHLARMNYLCRPVRLPA